MQCNGYVRPSIMYCLSYVRHLKHQQSISKFMNTSIKANFKLTQQMQNNNAYEIEYHLEIDFYSNQ